MADQDRDRALALLEQQHTFPMVWEFSVITVSTDEAFAAVKAAAAVGLIEPLDAEAHQTVPSRAGKYTSHRLRIPVVRAEDVLELYARMRAVVGLVQMF